MKNNTAILVFANSAEFESKNKSFKDSELLFDALNNNTLKIVKKTGLPFFHLSEKEQIGTTFGERFTNAIQTVFDWGFENVITVGNDTPHLQSKHILDAAQKLQDNQLVLGPSKDGGFYLMGLPKWLFNKNNFLKLPWQTKQLTKTFVKLIEKNNASVLSLEKLHDVDCFFDIQHVLKDTNYPLSLKLQQILRHFEHVSFNITNAVILFSKNQFRAASYNKGSPQLLHF